METIEDGTLIKTHKAQIVFIGANGVGKTSLLTAINGQNPFLHPELEHTCCQNFVVHAVSKQNDLVLPVTIVDVTAIKNPNKEQKKAISNKFLMANCGIFCYDVTDRESFNNLTILLKEFREMCLENKPIILVGLKTDLRDVNNNNHIDTHVGKLYANEIDAAYFFEFSTKDLMSNNNTIPVKELNVHMNRIMNIAFGCHNTDLLVWKNSKKKSKSCVLF